jgi:peptidoglycan/LPS O-acetylase OafA/YrhL
VGLAWLISFAVCIVSYRLLERPALGLKVRFSGAPAITGFSTGPPYPGPVEAPGALLDVAPASLVSRSG